MSMLITRPLLSGVTCFGGRAETEGTRDRPNAKVWFGKGVLTMCGVDISKRPSRRNIRECAEGLVHRIDRSVMMFEDFTDDEVARSSDTESRLDKVRSMFESINDGEISISAYDTAWVALVKNLDDGRERPQFPSAIEWIAENQLEDGSWGDSGFFYPYDRILCTLACVVALTTWKIHSDKCEKGISFLKETISMLEDMDKMLMPTGFELTLPSLMDIARGLEIEIPFDHPALREIYAWRETKLSRIPKDLLYQVPTTLLFSLEGMQMIGLNWEKILRFQCANGSFLASPSSTAFALMQTKDRGCLEYLNDVVQRFNGGVPNTYPVEVFERLWITDRLQRLGISRYFKEKLEEFMAYVSRLWTNNGFGWTRYSTVCDIDDTSMGFRLLRLYGHEVSPEMFKNFERDGIFFTYPGQSNESVTGMYNLLRASHLRFPEETFLECANNYSSKFLTEKSEADDLSDKWMISKGLPSEVTYALDVPFYASLSRLETRFYLEQYGGNSDVWIGKSYFRMYNISNNDFLELAKMDYKNCQCLHLSEWKTIQRWYSEWKRVGFGVSEKILLRTFFVAASTVFEPERSRERIAWTKSAILVKAVESHLGDASSYEHRKLFVREFNRRIGKQHLYNQRTNEVLKGLSEAMDGILHQLSLEMFADTGSDISLTLRDNWAKWMKGWEQDGETNKGIVELIAQTILLFGSGRHTASQEKSSYPHYQRLCDLTTDIVLRLSRSQKHKLDGEKGINDPQLDIAMQELVKLVVQDVTPGVDQETKTTFFEVTRGYYYATYFDDATIDRHVTKVLFENVH